MLIQSVFQDKHFVVLFRIIRVITMIQISMKVY